MNSRISLLLSLVFAVTLSADPANADPIDPLRDALSSWDLTRSDLGTRPNGYWTRFPRLAEVPHLLPSFPALFAEPLRMYDFGRTMGNAADIYLDPERPDTPSALHNLIYYLGVEKRVSGFRNYTTNIVTGTPNHLTLTHALRELWLRADLLLQYRTFGVRAEWPREPDSAISAFVSEVPAAIEPALTTFVANIGEVIHWWNIAMRNVDPTQAAMLFNITDLADTQGDGTRYIPELDDIASTLDEHALYYACMKWAASCDQLNHQLRDISFDRNVRSLTPVTLVTPLGLIVVGGTGHDNHTGPALAIIDLGGNDTYHGQVASSIDLSHPLGAVIDLSGHDKYVSETEFAQGSGRLGCGVLYDASGNDVYTAMGHAQGFGLFGLGVVYDRSGDDRFDMRVSGQGCGYFGIGLLLDGAGTDEYRIWAEGQGQGGIGGGVGVLATRGGNDLYYAESDAEIAGRADYHSELKITANNVQGSGNGRRGDGSDGHSWAGGLGVIIDVGGDDRYESGNWSLGVGYWFGTGILYDSEGDDVYRSVYFTQAAGAHFCNAALIDESGDDRHELWFNAGASIAFGWDFTNALLIDKSGDDFYQGGQSCVALATGRSTAILYDGGGDDEYRLDDGKAGFGESTIRDDFIKPSPVAPYMYYARSVGILLDAGGRDLYLRQTADGNTHPDTLAKDGHTWRNPDSDVGKNHGGGFDTEGGTVPEFYLWDE
jgi:hypothetical protein